MYFRSFCGLLYITGHSICKPKNATWTFNAAVNLNLQRHTQNYNSNFVIVRPCSIIRSDKDQMATEQLNELLKDPTNMRNYKVIELEIDIMRQSGENIPNDLKPRHWVELVQLKSNAARKRYLTFLFKNEKKKENLEKKKKERRESQPDPSANDTSEHLKYQLGHNTFFLRVYESTINRFYNWKLLQAIMFEQKIVLDCGYEDKMSRGEIKNCARQLQMAFAANRAHKNPLDLYFCNMNPNGLLHQELYSYIPTMYQPEFPINITTKSYLDLFDRDNLVYLTPDCKQELNKFDDNAVYIIGAVVDKSCRAPVSLAKAKKEGIRVAKLPLEKYLDWGSGSGKSLTLNQMINILVDLQSSNNWDLALRHVPKRKLYAHREYQNQRKIQRTLENQSGYNEQSPVQDFSFESRNKFRKN